MMHQKIVLRVVSKFLIPPIILFALYVQFHGDFGPGGGFQAGVILGAALVLYGLLFGVSNLRKVTPPWALRLSLVSGVLLYGGTGVWTLLLGGNYLGYNAIDPAHPTHGQHVGILLVEGGVGITVAAAIITIFMVFSGQSKHPDA